MAKEKQQEFDSKGGGYRGGPKRWAGNGPAPARHIPWPEVFKHHQSVLTGHLKMMDMIRKHCVEGSGNYETADTCVNRTQEMLRDFKRVSMSFVPPKDHFERVPIGVSSASMYPGYSPADHVYGEAAQEFGAQVSEMKKKGVEWKAATKGPEYTVGQRAVSEQKQMEEYMKKKAEESGDSEAEKPKATSAPSAASQGEPMDGVEATESDGRPLFFIDTEPTAVAGVNGSKSSRKEKRKVSFGAAEELASPDESQHKKKKTRSRASEGMPPNTDGAADVAVEQDDISAEVEARLKAKEEKKRLKKEERKRKRESLGSLVSQDESGGAAAEGNTNGVKSDENPKRKKQEKDEENAEAQGTQDDAAKKEKKQKKKRDSDVAQGQSKDANGNEGEKRKKKRKKDHSS